MFRRWQLDTEAGIEVASKLVLSNKEAKSPEAQVGTPSVARWVGEYSIRQAFSRRVKQARVSPSIREERRR